MGNKKTVILGRGVQVYFGGCSGTEMGNIYIYILGSYYTRYPTRERTGYTYFTRSNPFTRPNPNFCVWVESD